MSEVIRVIAAVVDTHRLTMYKPDGETIIIQQGDPLIRGLVDKVIPALEAQGFCDLSVTDLSNTSHYNQTEEELKGFVKFFRLAKTTLESLIEKFGHLDQETGDVAPVSAGTIPVKGPDGGYADGDSLQEAAPTKTSAAVAEIMANAKPTSSPEFHAPMQEEDTVVAVLENGKAIPGVEKLDIQLQAVAAKLGSAIGVQRFFERVSSVQRNHSVQDLLTFMQKGELPIADDGSVLVYKRLRSTSEAGVFVDCHSGNVKQRVGSHVFMDEKLVDPDRHQECSNGLHVARRDYLHSFSGDVTVLAKLAPEDVIAVPHRDARKLRAKGYHIVAQLSAEDAKAVCNNRPMTDSVLLGNVAAGNHIGIIETVEIGGHGGTNLSITEVAPATEVELDTDKQAQSLDNLPTQDPAAAQVDATQVAKDVAAKRKPSQKDQAQALYDKLLKAPSQNAQIDAAKALVAFKKAAKKHWTVLGISDKESKRILDIAQGSPQPEAEVPAPAKAIKPKAADWKPTGTTPRERIQELLLKPLTEDVAHLILKEKKAAKKGWEVLGVSQGIVTQVLKLCGVTTK